MKCARSGLLVLSLVLGAQAQSYEGFIDNQFPVWVDLKIRTGDGVVTGSYFYKKVGREIPLSGRMTDKNLRIGELDKKNIETAAFTLRDFGDSLSGTWKKAGGQDSIPVSLYKIGTEYRKNAKIPGPEGLILADGRTLADEMDELSGENVPKKRKRPKLEFSFARKNIVSTNYFWNENGYYPSGSTFHHNFDLSTKKEIQILEEIDTRKMGAFQELLKEQLREKLDGCRDDRSDSEWIDELGVLLQEKGGGKSAEESLDKMFQPNDLNGNVDFFFQDGILDIVLNHYFDLPSVIQIVDCYFDLKIPLAELKPYLKKNSPLRRIAIP